MHPACQHRSGQQPVIGTFPGSTYFLLDFRNFTRATILRYVASCTASAWEPETYATIDFLLMAQAAGTKW